MLLAISAKTSTTDDWKGPGNDYKCASVYDSIWNSL